jgi:hypothetical protein
MNTRMNKISKSLEVDPATLILPDIMVETFKNAVINSLLILG